MNDEAEFLALNSRVLVLQMAVVKLLCARAAELREPLDYIDDFRRSIADTIQDVGLAVTPDRDRYMRGKMQEAARWIETAAKESLLDQRNEHLTPGAKKP